MAEKCVGLFTDPGEVHTGFVIVAFQPREFTILSAGEVSGWQASADLIPHAVTNFGAALWVYEGFRLYEHKANAKTWSEFPEIETIGAMRQAARSFPDIQIKKQYASQIKIKPYEDKQLRVQGLDYGRFMSSHHTRDAFRHFLVYWGHYPIMQGLKGVPSVVGN